MKRTPGVRWFGTAVVLAGVAVFAQAPAGPIASAASVRLPAGARSLTAINRSSNVAAGLADGRIAIWNGRDATPAVMLKPHPARVLAVASTADGRDVWSLAADGSLARTPIAAGARPASRRLDLGTAAPTAAAFSSDGALLATGGDRGEIRVFDTASGALKQQLHGHRTELHYLGLRPGFPTLASASAEADLRIWDTTDGREIGSADGDVALFALAFSPRDGMLAVGGVDRRLTLRDATSFKPQEVLVLRAPRMVATLAWSPDGRLIALGDLDDETLSKGALQVVDAGTRAVVAELDTGRVPVAAVTFAGSAGVVIAIVGPELRAWTVPAPAR
jgi:WD40 repeat protein